MSRRAAARLTVAQCITEQERWIAEHGGTRAGYHAIYDAPTLLEELGPRANAIYEADTAELKRLQVLRDKGQRYL